MVQLLTLLATVLSVSSVAQDVPEPGQTEAVEAPKTPEELLKEFRTSGDRGVRKAAFDTLTRQSTEHVTLLKPEIDALLEKGLQDYAKLLIPKIRAEHFNRIGGLSIAEVEHVSGIRRLWKDYLLHGGGRENFREVYLKPVHEMGEYFLFDVQEIGDDEILEQRARLEEYAGYQAKCNAVLKINPDPTAKKKSPTGIAYAPLDQPPTFLDRLSHLERTLVMCYTVASEGARKVLMMCDEAAREIDVQEAEFTMFCNEIRMLTGTIAWRADPLGCAVTRDHSNDRKEGRASGHMSDVPGKRGFGDRNKRMGAPFHNSEGAGGGRNGRGYANGLSYGGGHTGPLYSLKRNCVGVGRRGGVYTSQYRLDREIVHPCPATEGELWMPPGISAKDIRNPALLGVYKALKAGAYGTAAQKVTSIRPRDDVDAALIKFFKVAVDVETDWVAKSIVEVSKTGDFFYTNYLLIEGQKRFKGIPRFDEQVAEVAALIRSKEAQETMRAGKIFYRILEGNHKEVDHIALMKSFIKRYEESPYAAAIRAELEDKEAKTRWFDAFAAKNPSARNYGYPPSFKKD